MMRLKIAVIGPQRPDDFAWEIAYALNQMGNEAKSFGSFLTPNFKDPVLSRVYSLATMHPRVGFELLKKKIKSIESFSPDLIITVESFLPEAVSELRKLGVPLALWFPDHVGNMGPLWMFSSPYTHLFFKEPALVRKIAEYSDLKVHLLPEACLPDIHRPIESNALQHVSVIGNVHPVRVRLLQKLINDGIPLKIYGRYSRFNRQVEIFRSFHSHEYLTGASKSLVMRNSVAVLNNLHPGEIEGCNKRLFEAASCGAAVVTESKLELGKYFDETSEVFSFSNYNELLYHLRNLFKDSQIGRDRGDKARIRASRDHNYHVRLTELLSICGQ